MNVREFTNEDIDDLPDENICDVPEGDYGDAPIEEYEEVLTKRIASGRLHRTVDTAKLDAQVQSGFAYVTIHPGDGFQYRNCLCAVIRVEYPFLVIEITDTTNELAPNVTTENTICFKNSYLKVINVKGNYLIVEFVGVKKGLAKAIERNTRIHNKQQWNRRAKKRKYRR
jgi:hypothetical protein